MHKNLVTRVSLEPEHNGLYDLKGFQEIISDFAYGTYYTIYGKFIGEFKKDNDGNDMKDFFKMKEVVLYLQNFTGQATVGLFSLKILIDAMKNDDATADEKAEFETERKAAVEKELQDGIEIDMAFDEGIKEPVYFITLYVTPLCFNPFHPEQTKSNIDEVTETLKDKKIPLETIPLFLKNQLSINRFVPNDDEKRILNELGIKENKYVEHPGYLNLKNKMMFHVSYLPYFHKDMLDENNIKKSIFLDDINYERQGEEITTKNFALDLQNLINVKPKSAINPENGRIIYTIKPCKNGIVTAGTNVF